MTSAALPATPAAPEALRPVAASERVALLDVLRGFALFGVLLANLVPWYSGRAFFPKEELAAITSRADEIALFVIRVLVDGKSMTLLSFLFGLGFSIQLERAEARGTSVVAVHLRRLAGLFVIGVCHILLLWWGDVLALYAFCGVFLVFFRRASGRAVLIAALLLIFVTHTVSAIPVISAQLDRLNPHLHDREAFNVRLLAALRGHDHLELARMQATQNITHQIGAIRYLPWTIGRFLLGYAFGRMRLIQDAPRHLPFFRKLLRWGLGLGLVCSLALATRRFEVVRAHISPPIAVALTIPDEIAVLGLAGGYLAALALLLQRPAWQRRLMVLAPLGRMALTNYLMQSLVCTFLFYGWGLDLIGRVGPALCVPLSLILFAAQILLSRLWLRRFRFGPMERVWRTMTYGLS